MNKIGGELFELEHRMNRLKNYSVRSVTKARQKTGKEDEIEGKKRRNRGNVRERETKVIKANEIEQF